jgi:hypothetical protein
MIRTQIQLEPEQHRALKRWASRVGISLAEAVRRCVADRLSREASPTGRADRVREAKAVVGKYTDPNGRSRVAQAHDDHLADAYQG